MDGSGVMDDPYDPTSNASRSRARLSSSGSIVFHLGASCNTSPRTVDVPAAGGPAARAEVGNEGLRPVARVDRATGQRRYDAWGRSSAHTTFPVDVGRHPHTASRPTIISP